MFVLKLDDIGIIIVNKNQSSAKVLSTEEFARRLKENDFAEFADGVISFFNSQQSGDWTVTALSINSSAPFEFSDAIQAIGGTRNTPVALMMNAKRLYAVCVNPR